MTDTTNRRWQNHIDQGVVGVVQELELIYKLPALTWTVSHLLAQFGITGHCSGVRDIQQCECSVWANVLGLVRFGEDDDLAIHWVLEDPSWSFQIAHTNPL